MFAGIIEHRAAVRESRHRGPELRLQVDLGPLAEELRIGESVAVNGVCLTVAAIADSLAAFDVSGETLRRTTIGSWRRGTAVNCERSLRYGDRVGGHLVAGHVDGVGRLVARVSEGAGERFDFALPEDRSVAVVEKGSVAVDGISLTSWGCRPGSFSVAVVPHTLRVTTLGGLRPGERVHLEQDMVGRWVAAGLAGSGGG